MLALLLQGCPRVSPTAGDDTEPVRRDSAVPDTAPRDSAAPSTANLLMISIDTLRVQDLGAYGGAAETDTLDALLAQGTQFTDLRSCSNWTYPSAACALLGEDLVTLGFLPGRAHGDDVERLPDDALRLGEHLQAGGFSTGLVSGNSIIGSGLGFARGYDEVSAQDNAPAETIVDEGLAMLDRLRSEDGRWGLHLHFMDPHLNYDPPEAYQADIDESRLRWEVSTKPGIVALVEDREAGRVSTDTWEAALAAIQAWYDAELVYLDDQLARLLEEVAARDEDVVVVLWSDHGESLGEHGAWFHHGTLHDIETRVLGAVVVPGDAPSTVDVPLDLSAILPATLAALGLAEAPTWALAPRYAEVLQEEGFQTSVDHDGQRLVYQAWTGELQRYDREGDPEELHDLSAPDDPATQALWALLEDRVSQLTVIVPEAVVIAPDLDETSRGSAR